jgi:hypothetical protein
MVEARSKTRFTKEQLVELRSQLFEELQHKEYIVIKEHRFTLDEILIISLYHYALGPPYSEMCDWLGGDCSAYTYPINWFDD